MDDWGYGSKNGPHSWSEKYPAVLGCRQTPINIIQSDAQFDQSLVDNQLSWSYQPENCTEMVNTGASLQVIANAAQSYIKGGPLKDCYKLEQFHFHWGKTCSEGSEHLIDGKAFASELHLVHWNADKYGSFAEAVSKEDGLCVLGVFIEVGDENLNLQNLIDMFDKVEYSKERTPLNNGFNPALLLPENTDRYWTYSGSLTTPPCYESVQWILLKQPITVSEKQLESFRGLNSHQRGKEPDPEFNGKIIVNFRPCFPVGDRIIRSTFRKFFT